jgi:serine/threonine protein kinase
MAVKVMSTEPQRTCPSCGSQLSGAMEFCPVCMLRKGLGGGVESGEPSASEDTVKPTAPEQVVQRFEHYELVTAEDGKPVELGRGAMGVTYKALDVDLRCTVTLKVISEKYLGEESARLRFLREARAAASVRHPNVASVFHLGRTGENYFYAMEFIEGETLENLIKRSGRLEVKLALEIATQVAAGLAAVHKQNLVHRDIKPSNIMVSLEHGGGVTAKIIDLGLARVCQSRAIRGSGRGHPFGSLFAWRDAVGHANRSRAISRFSGGSDESASARPLTARTARGYPTARCRFASGAPDEGPGAAFPEPG